MITDELDHINDSEKRSSLYSRFDNFAVWCLVEVELWIFAQQFENWNNYQDFTMGNSTFT